MPNAKAPRTSKKANLKQIADETVSVLPGLLHTRPDARADGFLYDTPGPLDQKFCPLLAKTPVVVVDCDTIDAALELATNSSPSALAPRPVCVLNMANARTAGGGWRNGAIAQEEALCFRTSLSFTLKLRYYPLPETAVIYSPSVLVIRESMQEGHQLLDARDPKALPVISVVSCAGIQNPPIVHGDDSDDSDDERYEDKADRELMAEKMRVVLRTAIRNRHRQIVLGALGCGVFGNPPRAVAVLWKQVLVEPEFNRGWWDNVVFAVLGGGKGSAGARNYRIFDEELSELLV